MASRFVEADEQFIEEVKEGSKTQNEVQTIGPAFFDSGRKQEEK